MTRDPAAVQTIARALSECMIVRCAECGQMETTTLDGRRRHEQLYDRRLSGYDKKEVR